MLRAVASIRISGQEQKLGDSPESQKLEILKKIETDGDCKLIEVYVDISKSAYLDNEDIKVRIANHKMHFEVPLNSRNNFEKLLLDAYEHKFDIVYFYKLDRLARNIIVQEGVYSYLASLGIEIRFVDDKNYSNKDPNDIFVRQVLGALNQKTSGDTSQKVMNLSHGFKFEQGIFFGRVPFGYEATGYKDEDKQKGITGFKIKEGEAERIKELFNAKINKEDYNITCSRLSLDSSQYYRLTKKKIYAGYLEHKGEEKFVKELEIVPLEVWKKVNHATTNSDKLSKQQA